MRRRDAGDAVAAVAGGGAVSARLTLPLSIRLPLGVGAVHAAAAAVALVGALRLFAAFRIDGPTFIPDEYMYAELGRAVVQGHWFSVRGETLHFGSILAPLLTAPAWLLGDVGVAYRVAQAIGVVAVMLAAVPAFLLARRLGLSERSAAVAAVAAVLVPDASFAGLLASEPFAYPLFLASVLAAVDAARAPTARRQLLFLGLWLLLCLARVQFFFLPLPYLVAAAAVTPHPLAFLRSQRVTLLGLGLLAGGVLAAGGPGTLVGRYGAMRHFSPRPADLVAWAIANGAVLAVACGWVTVPGAAVALVRFLRRGDPAQRAYASATIVTVGAVLGQAAVFGAALGQLIERYTFYVAPLLVVAFLATLEGGFLVSRVQRALLAAMCGAALLLPLFDFVFTSDHSQAPALVATEELERIAGWATPLLVAGVLLLVTVTALVLRRSSRSVVALSLLLPALASVGFSWRMAAGSHGKKQAAWQLRVPVEHASYLAFRRVTNVGGLETTLFWNPAIERVLVADGDTVDSFGSTPVRLASDGRLIGGTTALHGDVVVDRELVSLDGSGLPWRASGRFTVLDLRPDTRLKYLAAGLPLGGRPLALGGYVAVAADRAGAPVRRGLELRLRDARSHGWVLRFRCSNGFERTVALGPHERLLTLPLRGRGVSSCSFGLVAGPLDGAEIGSVDASARFVRG